MERRNLSTEESESTGDNNTNATTDDVDYCDEGKCASKGLNWYFNYSYTCYTDGGKRQAYCADGYIPMVVENEPTVIDSGEYLYLYYGDPKNITYSYFTCCPPDHPKDMTVYRHCSDPIHLDLEDDLDGDDTIDEAEAYEMCAELNETEGKPYLRRTPYPTLYICCDSPSPPLTDVDMVSANYLNETDCVPYTSTRYTNDDFVNFYGHIFAMTCKLEDFPYPRFIGESMTGGVLHYDYECCRTLDGSSTSDPFVMDSFFKANVYPQIAASSLASIHCIVLMVALLIPFLKEQYLSGGDRGRRSSISLKNYSVRWKSSFFDKIFSSNENPTSISSDKGTSSRCKRKISFADSNKNVSALSVLGTNTILSPAVELENSDKADNDISSLNNNIAQNSQKTQRSSHINNTDNVISSITTGTKDELSPINNSDNARSTTTIGTTQRSSLINNNDNVISFLSNNTHPSHYEQSLKNIRTNNTTVASSDNNLIKSDVTNVTRPRNSILRGGRRARLPYHTYNMYLVFMAIPDLLLNIYLLGMYGSYVNQNYNPNFHGYIIYNYFDFTSAYGISLAQVFEGSFVMGCSTASMYLNMFVAYEILDLLKNCNRIRRHRPPSLRKVYIQATTSFLTAAFIFGYCYFAEKFAVHFSIEANYILQAQKYDQLDPLEKVLNPEIAEEQMKQNVVLNMKADTLFYSLVIITSIVSFFIPVGYLCYACFVFWYRGLAKKNGRKMSQLALYFFRIILVFFLCWIPGVSLIISGAYGKHGNKDAPYIAIGYLFCSVQSILSFWLALTKSDVRKYVTNLIQCNFKDPEELRGQQPASRRTSRGSLR